MNDPDRFTAVIDGDELDVYNVVTVLQRHLVRPDESTTTDRIFAGAHLGGHPPEAVTESLAQWLWEEFSIDVAETDVRVVDISDPEVELR